MDSSHASTETSFDSLPTQPHVFEEGMRKLSRYRQIAVIGLCKKGDVRFCRCIVRFLRNPSHV